MDVAVPSSRSSPQLTARHSRRSFPNLTHLSLAPLSSRFPIDDDGYGFDDPDPALSDASSKNQPNLHLHIPRSSYIQGKSAPTTPSILSRGASPSGTGGLRHSRSHRTRRRPANPSYVHDAAVATSAPGPIYNKAKSTTVLHPPGHNPGFTASALRSRAPVTSSTGKPAMQASATATTADEWLHRAGLAITTAAIETKGQSWLVSRASSTSLVNDNADLADAAVSTRPSYAGTADDECSPLTPRHVGGAFGSRFGSRAASARNSRRGSRAGSRADMGMAGMGFTPAGPGGGVQGGEGYFDDDDAPPDTPVEPDFVDPAGVEEEEDYISGELAEEEVKRLATERGFGFGGLVDRLIGWPLFNVEEDGEDADEAAEPEDEAPRKRREESERKAVTPKVQVPPPAPRGQGEGKPGEGGWKDAAWLLSVASKVIL